jgi:hydrogenase-4 component B
LIAVGLGAALVFRSAALPVLAGMALIAALFHLLNHSLYKSLLFLGAGAVDAAAGTRDMDALGGLARRMPWTSVCFLVGCLAISALPPFNGFASEWLTIQSLLRSTELASPAVRIAFAIAGALVALTAGLAVTAFVKLFALSFLGIARSEPVRKTLEVSRSQRAAMVLLAALCLLGGLVPTYIVTALGPVADDLGEKGGAAALVPPFFAPGDQLPAKFVAEFHDLGAQTGAGILPEPGLVLMHRGGSANPVVFASAPSYLAPAITLALLVLWLVVAVATRRRQRARRAAWDGGLHRLLPEFTYSATGFSQPARVIFRSVLAPDEPVQQEHTTAEHFRTAIYRAHDADYALDRWIFIPLLAASSALARVLAAIHHGRLNAYVGYALLTLLVVCVAVST